jgi:hypothetical protein
MGAKQDYLAWKKKSKDVGCVFARYMAAKPTQFGQRIEIVSGSRSTSVASRIETLVSRFIADSAVSALTLLLPKLTDLAALVDVVHQLERVHGWKVKRWSLPNAAGGAVVAICLTRDVPLGSRTVPSEALILGNFGGFPATRRAPVTALEIFVGPPPSLDRRDGQPTKKANLADVDLGLQQALHDNMWEGSRRLRLESLGGADDDRAKAKVAFVVPVALAGKFWSAS